MNHKKSKLTDESPIGRDVQVMFPRRKTHKRHSSQAVNGSSINTKRKLFDGIELADDNKKQKKSIDIESNSRQKPLTERQQLAYLLEMTAREYKVEQCNNIHENEKEDRLKNTNNNKKQSSKITKQNTTKLNKRNERGETALHLFAIKGDYEGVQDMIKQGADVNIKDYADWTPLHEACNHGHYRIVKKLLKAGANVNVQGLENDTPLHDACSNGHVKVVDLLMKFGADAHIKNRQGETPIDMADCDEVYDCLYNFLDKSTDVKKPETDDKNDDTSISKKSKHSKHIIKDSNGSSSNHTDVSTHIDTNILSPHSTESQNVDQLHAKGRDLTENDKSLNNSDFDNESCTSEDFERFVRKENALIEDVESDSDENVSNTDQSRPLSPAVEDDSCDEKEAISPSYPVAPSSPAPDSPSTSISNSVNECSLLSPMSPSTTYDSGLDSPLPATSVTGSGPSSPVAVSTTPEATSTATIKPITASSFMKLVEELESRDRTRSTADVTTTERDTITSDHQCDIINNDNTSSPGDDNTSSPDCDVKISPKQDDNTSSPGNDNTSSPDCDVKVSPKQDDNTSSPDCDVKVSPKQDDNTSSPDCDVKVSPKQDDNTSSPDDDNASSPDCDVKVSPKQDDNTSSPDDDNTSNKQDYHTSDSSSLNDQCLSSSFGDLSPETAVSNNVIQCPMSPIHPSSPMGFSHSSPSSDLGDISIANSPTFPVTSIRKDVTETTHMEESDAVDTAINQGQQETGNVKEPIDGEENGSSENVPTLSSSATEDYGSNEDLVIEPNCASYPTESQFTKDISTIETLNLDNCPMSPNDSGFHEDSDGLITSLEHSDLHKLEQSPLGKMLLHDPNFSVENSPIDSVEQCLSSCEEGVDAFDCIPSNDATSIPALTGNSDAPSLQCNATFRMPSPIHESGSPVIERVHRSPSPSKLRVVDLEPCDIVREVLSSDVLDSEPVQSIPNEPISTCLVKPESTGETTAGSNKTNDTHLQQRSPSPTKMTWRRALRRQCSLFPTSSLPADYQSWLLVSKQYRLQSTRHSQTNNSCDKSLLGDLVRRQQLELEKLQISFEQELVRVESRCSHPGEQQPMLSACKSVEYQVLDTYNKLPSNGKRDIKTKVTPDIKKLRCAWLEDLTDKYSKLEDVVLKRHDRELASAIASHHLAQLTLSDRKQQLRRKYHDRIKKALQLKP